MHNIELINPETSYTQSKFRYGSVVATTVIMEFTLQA